MSHLIAEAKRQSAQAVSVEDWLLAGAAWADAQDAAGFWSRGACRTARKLSYHAYQMCSNFERNQSERNRARMERACSAARIAAEQA